MNWSNDIESKSFTRPYPRDNNLNAFGDYHSLQSTWFRRKGETEIIAKEHRLIGTNPEAKAPIPGEEYQPVADNAKVRVLSEEEFRECVLNLFTAAEVAMALHNCEIGCVPKFLTFGQRFFGEIDMTDGTVVLTKEKYDAIIRDARGY